MVVTFNGIPKQEDFYVGMDPGLDGALVVLHGREVFSIDLMPVIGKSGGKRTINLHDLWSWPANTFPKGKNNIHICLEQAQAMPKQGGVSMFNYGKGYGNLEVLCRVIVHMQAFNGSINNPGPKKWQKEMHQNIPTKFGPKERSLLAAQTLFPRVNLLATDRSRKPHEGIIDALLIAEYCRRINV